MSTVLYTYHSKSPLKLVAVVSIVQRCPVQFEVCNFNHHSFIASKFSQTHQFQHQKCSTGNPPNFNHQMVRFMGISKASVFGPFNKNLAVVQANDIGGKIGEVHLTGASQVVGVGWGGGKRSQLRLENCNTLGCPPSQ